MRTGKYSLLLASLVVQVAFGCSSDDKGDVGTAGAGGGDSAGTAGASGSDTGDEAGGAAGASEGGAAGATEGGAAGATEGGAAGASEGGAAGAPGTAGSPGSAGQGGAAGSDPGSSGYDVNECPPCERGCAAGDPHIITFDGAYYDFQAAGEYVITAAGDLVVQARLQPTDTCQDVAYVRAVAFGSADSSISVHADTERFVRLSDGTSLALGEADTEFGDWQLVSACNGVVATSTAGDQVIVHYVGENWLDVEVRPGARSEDFGGLFGNFDGDETNDIALPDGTRLPDPTPWEGLYGAFGGSWAVTEENSLFVYDSGESAADYAGGGMPGTLDLSTIPEEDLAAAAVACAGVTETALYEGCITDVVCGGADAEVAAAWFKTDPNPEVVLDVEPPTTVYICDLVGYEVMDLDDNTIDCPANCGAMGTIWGTDLYTDDSAICTAAIHAGLIEDAVGGTVTVHREPGLESYEGTTRNGITSLSYGEWDASFSLE